MSRTANNDGLPRHGLETAFFNGVYDTCAIIDCGRSDFMLDSESVQDVAELTPLEKYLYFIFCSVAICIFCILYFIYCIVLQYV